MENDVPNSLVVVLVVVAILVSVLGTWTIIESSSRTPIVYDNDSSKEGTVSLRILETPKSETVSNTASLGLTIIKPEV